MKAILDEEARGEQVSQQRGEPIGQIRLLEQLLDRSPTDSEELANLTSGQLATPLAELQRILRERKD